MQKLLEKIMRAVNVGKQLSVPHVCKNKHLFEQRRITPASVLCVDIQ